MWLTLQNPNATVRSWNNQLMLAMYPPAPKAVPPPPPPPPG